MTKFHTTVNRRDFIKGLGLAGAGIGTASLVGPQFQDMDELIASSKANFKHGWWVKEREAYNPTVDVDWDQIVPWKRGPTNPKKTPWFLAKQESDAVNITDKLNTGRWGRPFIALRAGASDSLGSSYSEFTTLDAADKWQGTPEEAANIIRAGMSYLGSPEVHFMRIDEKTRKLFQKDSSTADLEAGNCKSIIVSLVRKDISVSRRGGGDPFSYSHRSVIRERMKKFVTNLGYNCVSVPQPSNSAFGVLSGSSELSRIDHACSPRFGMAIKVHNIYATDLELPEDKPIDAGITRFCHTCKVCAELCHLQGDGISALSMETEPTWDLPTRLPASDGNVADYKRVGVKKWFADYAYCRCIHSCWQDCTFNQLNNAFAHDLIRMTIPQTGIFNGFFANMDRLFEYGSKPTELSPAGYQRTADGIEEWWKRDLNTWPYDVHPSGDNLI